MLSLLNSINFVDPFNEPGKIVSHITVGELDVGFVISLICPISVTLSLFTKKPPSEDVVI